MTKHTAYEFYELGLAYFKQRSLVFCRKMSQQLKELREALHSSELFICNFYFSLRSDIDLTCEELLAKNASDQHLSNQLNELREKLIAVLKRDESECMDFFKSNRQSISSMIEPINAHFKRLNVELGEAEDLVEVYLFTVRKILLKNRTYIYQRWSGKNKDRSIGRLLVIDCSFDSREIELIK